MQIGRAFRLLAIAPSGETYFVEIDGKTWLIRPPGAGGPRLVDAAVVERAVAYHGFEPEDRVFATPEDLDAYRNEVAARVVPEVTTRVELFDEVDVRRMLDVARRWQAAGDGRSAGLLRTLLSVPVVDKTPHLWADVVTLLKREVPSDPLAAPAPTAVGRKARAQFQLPQAA